MNRHDYSPDSSAVDRAEGEPVGCVLCGMPRGNLRVHFDALRDDESRRVEARILGESDVE